LRNFLLKNNYPQGFGVFGTKVSFMEIMLMFNHYWLRAIISQ